MKKQILTAIAILISTLAFSQTDTIYTNNKKIACTVTEVAPDVIKYTYPGETLTNSIYKNSIQKIKFKSGREEVFSEATFYKKVEKPGDYEKVTITQVEGEVKGLFKVGDVSSKAKGTSTLSNQERVKERAYRKLKMQAAMQGANIIYLTNQRTEGNKFGSRYQSGSSAETNLSGVAYSSELPSFEKFKKTIGDKIIFTAFQKIKLWGSGSDLSVSELNSKFQITSLKNENGLIEIEGKLEGENKYTKFRVVHFSENDFNIFYEGKSSVYNVTVTI